MSTSFAVLGAGTQGTAAAYDLALHGNPSKLWLADASLAQATRAADRVNALVGGSVATPVQVDASDPSALADFLRSVDVALCCLPYWLQPGAVRAAIAARTHICDLDGEDPTIEELAALDTEAKAAGVTLVPDTGLAPGLVNSIGIHLIESLDEVESVKLYCGVLPQHPRPPLNYKLAFNVEGLVAEYDEPAIVLRNGEVVTLEPLTETEELVFDGIQLEAFVTGGGVSTAPYTLQGRVPNYEYKTLRFPGHGAYMRAFRDLGFWRTDEMEVDGVEVKPRRVFARLLEEALASDGDRDQCFTRGTAVGLRNGERVRLTVDIYDREDEETGFTSMQRLTGFSIAIHAIALAKGDLPTGALRYEEALRGAYVIGEMEARGIRVVQREERVTQI
ncbi:MAG: saccharopine dehydrogenase family protein [Fimbriimonas sp.]